MDIGYFLKLMKDRNASDMFLSLGAPIHLKIAGALTPVGSMSMPPGLVKRIAYSIMDEKQIARFETELEMNLAVQFEDIGRFRVNVFQQRGEIGMVFRAIKHTVPDIEELQLPPVLKELIMKPRGLVLVVGSTGSGKSTTLASMIDYRNTNSPGHILTIEDPIEYLHPYKKSIVNQREVGFDTHSYRDALKNAMREAPDVVMIGEIRDAETMEAALAFSETGHLCLATLHSSNADQTLERILNFFPASAHRSVLLSLALNLRGIVAQRLLVAKDGQRLPSVEVLIDTPHIRDMIRGGQLHEIKEAMEHSLSGGIQTFDQDLLRLYRAGRIDLEEALSKADSRDGLALKIRLGEGEQDASLPGTFGMLVP